MLHNSPTYWFQLGHEPLLSLAELTNFFQKNTFNLLSPSLATTENSSDLSNTIGSLGGTVRIAIELVRNVSEAALIEHMCNELLQVEGKIHFGISILPNTGHSLTAKDSERFGMQVKRTLKESGHSVRFVANRGMLVMSSATVQNNGLALRGREFLVLAKNGTYSLAKTVAVQPFEQFSERDFGRPGRDDVSGMLPPKLAMMMINCSGNAKNEPLYDPSCGSGTIISEAFLMGYTTILGSDISEKAIVDSERNISWLQTHHLKTDKPSTTLFVNDARVAPSQITPHSVGAIVSEPYMGPPLKGSETDQVLQKNTEELQSLYLDSFETFAKLVRPGGSIIYILPRFSTRDRLFRTSTGLIAKIAELGFTHTPLLPETFSKEPYILYQREHQRVGREIWKFIRK